MVAIFDTLGIPSMGFPRPAAAFADEARALNVARMHETHEAKRVTLAVAFIRSGRLQALA